ncbi:MAG: amidohydrolase family protein [Reyranella sp.]|uniref:amidohydrolase family protein n=1 Tax=Reyranella sp. TaxID=1929291 RepID=UPI001AC73ECA|nr:amidohydrolase family protein [Reyranella sp.]MBN9089267.1 amidohydrolase family protein [Reyranella sp.]
MKKSLAAVLLLLPLAARAETEMPIFDAHLHYSHDAWEVVPPQAFVDILRKANIKRALVSSSNNEGTKMLQDRAPEIIVPELRPYRSRGELGTWAKDPTVIPFIEDLLAKRKYVAIGEFHIYSADADLPNMRRVVQLARHSDADAVERHFAQDPEARVRWAHSGFERPETVRAMLSKHRNLWCDLAFLTAHASNGKVTPGWREAFLEFPDRFLVGTDSFTPERLHYVAEHARWSRQWLADLPRDTAEKIGFRNGERLFGGPTP